MSPLTIFSTITVPIFVLIAAGYLLDRAVRLDVQTLGRVHFYIFVPALVFMTITRSDLQGREILSVAGFAALHTALVGGLAFAVFSLRPFASRRTLLSLGSAFYNAGNYGFPLMLLAFNERAVSVMAIVLLVQIILLFTGGLLLLVGEENGLRESARRLLGMPVIYAIILGFVVRALNIELPVQLAMPISQVYNGFIAVALIALGVQLARSKFNGDFPLMTAAVIMRLLISPALALLVTRLFGFSAELTAVLVLGAGLPAAVNVFILATEFDREADFVSRIIFWTTLLSAGTIPVLLWLIR